jgi:hypothetical protein
VPLGVDAERYARVLARTREATLAGEAPSVRPRPVIEQSWARVTRFGVDPDHGYGPDPESLSEVERRRQAARLDEYLPIIQAECAAIADDARHIAVVVDADVTVLWREGSHAVRRMADRLGFVDGASWSEASVGTNAIGTAAADDRSVQIFAAEHFVRTHHPWWCAAAPIHDPASGRLLAVLDVSGPAPSVHPSTLALVDAVARLAEQHLRTTHHRALDGLRALAVPLLSRIDGRVIVTDEHGWIAAVSGIAPMERLMLPKRMQPGPLWLPSIGRCRAEPLPGGWLVRVDDDPSEPMSTMVTLDLRSQRRSRLGVTSTTGVWECGLTPRHAEILFLLALHREGMTAAALAEALFGNQRRVVTVRAELSRLRRHLGGLLDHQPYRFGDGVDVSCELPDPPSGVLSYSSSPAIIRLRTGLNGST